MVSIKLTFALCVFFLCSEAFSSEADFSENNERLHFSPKWLSLLHYYPIGGKWRSRADSSGFFLSNKGSTDPKEELSALMSEMRNDSKVLDDRESVQCRFPARVQWLRQHTSFSEVSGRRCIELTNWKKSLETERISILFASASMDNPSSMFGHTFLRFYRKNDTSLGLNSNSLNYYADAGEKLNFLSYIYKGFGGGFWGVIDNRKMFRRLRDYSDDQGRDLWEYELNFSQSEIKLIINHAWEIKGKAFRYYFITENCSYRTLELLALVKPDLLVGDKYRYRSIPIDSIRQLIKGGYVSKSKYIPSSKSVFYSQFQELSISEKRLLELISSGGLDVFKDNRLISLSKEDQSYILMLSMKYVGIKIQNSKTLDNDLKNTLAQIIQARVGLDTPSPLRGAEVTTPIPPEYGHESTKVTFSGVMSGGESFQRVGARFSGHSILDPIIGSSFGAALDFSELKVKIKNGGVGIDSFILLNAFSVNPTTRYFPSKSWMMDISYRGRGLGLSERKVFNIGGGYGYSLSLAGHNFSLLSKLGINSLEASKNLMDVEYGAVAGVIMQSNILSYKLSLDHSWYINNSIGEKVEWEASVGVPIGRNVLLGYSYAKGKVADSALTTTHELSVNLYF